MAFVRRGPGSRPRTRRTSGVDCLANTVRDIAAQFSDPKYISKIHLLRDATGNVPGFEALGEDFVRELSAKGMKVTTTTDFIKAA